MTAVEQHPSAPEEHLLRYRRTRDPEALGALFEATAPTLLRVALATAPDPASAENALQETFLAVLAAPERWDEQRPVMPWLLGILYRHVGTIRRDRARVPDPLRIPPPLREVDPAEAAASRDELERVRGAIEELPEPYRQVALLRWRHGLEPAEIAHLRSEPPGTTRSLLSRALERLRTRLGALAVAWFGGGEAPQGIQAMRREIVRRARSELGKSAARGAAGATAAAAAAAGGIVMKKLAVVCLLLVLLGMGTWGAAAWIAATRDAAVPGTTTIADADEAPEPVARRARARTDTVAPAPAEALPPVVDFATLDPDRDIAGRVVSPDGAPIGGASVQVRDHTWKRLGDFERIDDGPRARTAADGSFAVRVEPGVPISLVVRADRFPEQVRDECRAGQRVTIRLAKGFPVTIEVVDDVGAPVPGATVRLACTMPYGAARQNAEAVTGADGVAAIPAVLGPWANVRVTAQGVPGEQWGGTVLVPQDAPHRVALPKRTAITGLVSDRATGAPIVGARVGIRFFTYSGVCTNSEGRYTLPAWAWERTVDVVATADGYGTAASRLEHAGELDFALDRAFVVRGRVVDPDRSPLAGVKLAVLARTAIAHQTARTAAVSGSDGRFEVAAAVPGATQHLVAVAAGYSRAVVAVPAATVGGQPCDAGDVVLSRGHRLSGVAIDSDGGVCAGDFVYAYPADSAYQPQVLQAIGIGESVQTDDEGRFRFDALAPGEWLLSLNAVDAPRRDAVRVTIPPDSDVEGVRVELTGSRTLVVRVVDETGAPVRKANVTVDGDFGYVGRSRYPLSCGVDHTGRATFRGLPAAPVRPYANAPMDGSVMPYKQSAQVMPEGQEVTFVLERAAPLAGRVLDADGAPLVRHYVAAYAAGASESVGIAETKDDGSFRILVPAGTTVDVRLRGDKTKALGNGAFTTEPSGYEGALPQVRAPAEGLLLRATRESLALDRSVTIVLVDAYGVPVEGIPVDAYWQVGVQGVHGKTDAEGRVVLQKLPGRNVDIGFQTGARRNAVQGLQVPPDRLSLLAEGQEVRATYRVGAAIRGRLRNSDGKALRGNVHVRTPEYTYNYALTDAEGRFEVAGLPDTAHYLEASAWIEGVEWKATRLGVKPGGDEIELVLQPAQKRDE